MQVSSSGYLSSNSTTLVVADRNKTEASQSRVAEPSKLAPAPVSVRVDGQDGDVHRAEKSSSAEGPSPRDPAEDLRIGQQIQALAKRDKEVKTHERIHASLAGAHGGPAQFQFQRGPDGVLYAVSGHVSIDASPIPGDPAATIRKAQTIQRAALGPADPSAADRSVAARASAMEVAASAELAELVALQNRSVVTANDSQLSGDDIEAGSPESDAPESDAPESNAPESRNPGLRISSSDIQFDAEITVLGGLISRFA